MVVANPVEVSPAVKEVGIKFTILQVMAAYADGKATLLVRRLIRWILETIMRRCACLTRIMYIICRIDPTIIMRIFMSGCGGNQLTKERMSRQVHDE